MAEIGQIPETPPGMPTGFGLAASGGMLPNDCGLTVFQHACRSARRHRLEAARLALSLRPLDGLAKFKNPQAPAVRREAEEDWGRWPKARTAS